jgi:hypothetical protein
MQSCLRRFIIHIHVLNIVTLAPQEAVVCVCVEWRAYKRILLNALAVPPSFNVKFTESTFLLLVEKVYAIAHSCRRAPFGIHSRTR